MMAALSERCIRRLLDRCNGRLRWASRGNTSLAMIVVALSALKVLFQPLFKPVDRIIAGLHGFGLQQLVEERNCCIDAVDNQLAERPVQTRQRFGTITAVNDQLGDQRIVIGRDAVAIIKRAIHPHAEPAGRVVLGDRAGAGRKLRQLLGVDPNLDRVTLHLQVFLAERHRLAGGNADLFADEVHTHDRLGHRMLHLQAGVHLDEIEFSVLVEKFDRARALVAQFGHGVGTDHADAVAHLGRDGGTGSFLEHLLMAPL
mmetsp:Transcript_3165/g.5450  ORF Transcript_3165/g.5450 Transcript_3165/m.5450 type:complete len:258 (-) Transcript_3165:95-868(-)